MSVASGSLAEVETQILIANRLDMLILKDMEPLLAQAESISKMLGGFKRSLELKR